MPLDFSQQLLQAKRKANLRGRPLTRQEVESITAGVASEASTRNVQGRSLDLETERLNVIKEQGATELRLAEEALRQEKQAMKTGAAIGVGALAFGPQIAGAGEAITDFTGDFIRTAVTPDISFGDFFSSYFGW